MIRYSKTIEMNITRNEEIRLKTDYGQTWHATLVKDFNPFGEWLHANHTKLREYQRDMIQLIHQAYNKEYDMNSIDLYWVYQRGKGYKNQSHDVALAHIPSKYLWILMTSENTWLLENKYNNFNFRVEDASGSVTDEYTQDLIWNFRDYMLHGKTFAKKKRAS